MPTFHIGQQVTIVRRNYLEGRRASPYLQHDLSVIWVGTLTLLLAASEGDPFTAFIDDVAQNDDEAQARLTAVCAELKGRGLTIIDNKEPTHAITQCTQ